MKRDAFGISDGDRDGPLEPQVPPIETCRILVADGDDKVTEFIDFHLREAGFHEIIIARDGVEAWSAIEEREPDLAILEYDLPDRSGLDVVRLMREHPALESVPVILETATDSPDLRKSALTHGATHVLSKPLDSELLLQSVVMPLQNRVLTNSLRSYQQRLRQELDMARQMQESLLPNEDKIREVRDRFDVKLDGHYRPSSELGGDCWGADAINQSKFCIYNVDFTGHGVGSAINTFRLHALMNGTVPPMAIAGDFLSILNFHLHGLLPRGQFATMHYGVVDISSDTYTFASAGSTQPIFGHPDNAELLVADSSGLPLGISQMTTYEERSVEFPPGSFAFLYSDALIETPDRNGNVLELDQLIDLVSAAKGADASEAALNMIIEQFYSVTDLPLPDDLTAIWLTR